MCFINFADVSIAVVDLLQEMTDVDTLTENEDGASVLFDALVGFVCSQNSLFFSLFVAKICYVEVFTLNSMKLVIPLNFVS